MMTDDEIIAVVQAHKEGKKIQWVGRFEADKDINWRDDLNPRWNFDHLVYRVAPEPRKPREWMVVEKGDAICSCWSGDNHIRVREILDEATSGFQDGDGITMTNFPQTIQRKPREWTMAVVIDNACETVRVREVLE